MAFEKLKIDNRTNNPQIRVGLGRVMIPRQIFDADFVSVEVDRKTGMVRLTREKEEGWNCYSMARRSYNGFPFSAIANYLNVFSQMGTTIVPHEIRNGKLWIDMSSLEKRKKV